MINDERTIKMSDKKLQPEAAWHIGFDDEKIWRTMPSAERSEIKWREVKGIFIETNDSGPFGSDVWWFVAGDEYTIQFPMGATGEKEMMSRFQQLPNFDNEALIDAMCSVHNNTFLLWKKE
jgi:hypothetical protein